MNLILETDDTSPSRSNSMYDPSRSQQFEMNPLAASMDNINMNHMSMLDQQTSKTKVNPNRNTTDMQSLNDSVKKEPLNEQIKQSLTGEFFKPIKRILTENED